MSKKKQFTAREIADVLVREGTSQTTTGRWSVGFEEIQNRFGLDLSADSDAGRLIVIALKQEEEINELIMTEDHIEMSYHLEYCLACNQGGSSGMGSVFSLLGCNIYDAHLRGMQAYQRIHQNRTQPRSRPRIWHRILLCAKGGNRNGSLCIFPSKG